MLDKAELKRVSDLVLFARVVQVGSISRCADILEIDRTTVSRRLKLLEDSLGVTLLTRTNRVIGTTEAGRRCFEVCLRLLDDLGSFGFAAAGVRASQANQSVSVVASPDLMDSFLDAAIGQFEQTYPRIDVRRRIETSEPTAPDSPPSLSIGWDSPRRRSGLTRRLLDVPQAVYASPDFARRYEYITEPDQLRNVPCIVSDGGEFADSWRFSKGSEEHRVAIDGALVTNTLLAAREAAIAGFGFCLLPRYLGDHFVKYGRLSKVLKKYRPHNRRIVSETNMLILDDGNLALLRVFLENYFAPSDSGVKQISPLEPPLQQPQLSSG